MEKEIRIKLKSPVKCGASDGQFKEYKEIVVMPPRPRDDSLAFTLGSEFSRARLAYMASIASMVNQVNDGKSDGESESNKSAQDKVGADIIIETLMSGGANYAKLTSSVKSLLSAGSHEKPQCYFDGDDRVQMTDTLFNDMSINDKWSVIGEYIANFISS